MVPFIVTSENNEISVREIEVGVVGDIYTSIV
jgi:hypothetical protein